MHVCPCLCGLFLCSLAVLCCCCFVVSLLRCSLAGWPCVRAFAPAHLVPGCCCFPCCPACCCACAWCAVRQPEHQRAQGGVQGQGPVNQGPGAYVSVCVAVCLSVPVLHLMRRTARVNVGNKAQVFLSQGVPAVAWLLLFLIACRSVCLLTCLTLCMLTCLHCLLCAACMRLHPPALCFVSCDPAQGHSVSPAAVPAAEPQGLMGWCGRQAGRQDVHACCTCTSTPANSRSACSVSQPHSATTKQPCSQADRQAGRCGVAAESGRVGVSACACV